MYGRMSRRRLCTARAYLVTARPRHRVGRILRRQDLAEVVVLVVAEDRGGHAFEGCALHEGTVTAGIHEARRRIAPVVEAILIGIREAERVADFMAERAAH